MTLRRLLPLCMLAVLSLGVRADDLPPDAKKIIEEEEKAAEAIISKAEAQLKKAQEEHAKAQEEVKQRKARMIATLEALATRLDKEGKTKQAQIITEQIEELKTGRVAGAQPNPGTMTGFRGQNGKTFIIDVTGQVGAGTVWGTDIYTDDSAIAAAVVHAGILKNGERGAVKITVLAGEAAYQGTTRNGVTTSDYGQWNGSYKIEAHRKIRPGAGKGNVMANPGTLEGFRGQIGQSFLFEVTGDDDGDIWGTDIYTDDSELATVAVHAGVLKVGEKGIVKVTILAGQQAYQDSTRNGVSSEEWDEWDGSYRVEKAPKK